jgi:hypothetical protein
MQEFSEPLFARTLLSNAGRTSVVIMDRPKVINWLLEHREYWDLSRFEIAEKMREAKLISRKTYWADIKVSRLIREARVQAGEAVLPPKVVSKKHDHKCTDCYRAITCYTVECPYPKAVQCEACKEGLVATDKGECRFELEPLHCAKCGVLIEALGTCDDFAYCAKHALGEDHEKTGDTVWSPKNGSYSGMQRSRV